MHRTTANVNSRRQSLFELRSRRLKGFVINGQHVIPAANHRSLLPQHQGVVLAATLRTKAQRFPQNFSTNRDVLLVRDLVQLFREAEALVHVLVLRTDVFGLRVALDEVSLRRKAISTNSLNAFAAVNVKLMFYLFTCVHTMLLKRKF